MSRMGDLYIDMTEDAQSMTRDEFVAKWGSFYAEEWHRLRDPDYYDYPEPEYD